MTTRDVSFEHDLTQLLARAGWVRRLARSMVHDDASAADLLQDAWLSASGSSGDVSSQPRSWLATVLRNLSRKGLRSDGRRLARERRYAATASSVATPEELLGRVQMERTLVELVVALAEPLRQVVLLYYFEEWSSPAIAKELGVPEGTVRWRLKIARDQLRAQLATRLGASSRRWLGVLAILPARRVSPTRALTYAAAGIAAGIYLATLAGTASSKASPATQTSLTMASAVDPPPVKWTPPPRNGLNPGLAACIENLTRERSVLLRLERERFRWRRSEKLFAEEEPNPRATIELAPIVLQVLKGTDRFPPAYTFECRTWICRLILYRDEDAPPATAAAAETIRRAGALFAMPDSLLQREPGWSVRIQTDPELHARIDGGSSFGRPTFDPITGKGLIEYIRHFKLRRPTAEPIARTDEVALNAFLSGTPPPAPRSLATCTDQTRAVRERLEIVRADVDATRPHHLRFNEGKPNPALAAELTAALSGPAGVTPPPIIECRASICRLMISSVDDQIEIRRAFRRNGSLRTRVNSLASGQGLIYYEVASFPRLDGELILRARLAELRGSGSLARCEALAPARGLLRVRLVMAPNGQVNDDGESEKISVQYGGDLASTPLGRCVRAAVEERIVALGVPSQPFVGIGFTEDIRFPIDVDQQR